MLNPLDWEQGYVSRPQTVTTELNPFQPLMSMFTAASSRIFSGSSGATTGGQLQPTLYSQQHHLLEESRRVEFYQFWGAGDRFGDY